jgi:5-hydroxyisourate hydrolase-like protein (transthyretin family)
VGGGAIAGARVLAFAPGSQAPDLSHSYQAITGTDGGYQLTLARRGRYLMVAEADGYAQARLRGVVMDGDQSKDITLEPAAQVAGQVFDGAQGQPAPGAVVRLARQRSEAPFLFTAIADAEGAWRVEGLVPGEYRVWARRGPRAGRLAQPLVVEAATAVNGVTLTLEAGRAIRGRVGAADGKPLAGAELWFDKEEGGISQDKQALAGADGAFVIEGVLPGRYRLRAAFPGHRGGDRALEVAGADLEGVDLVLSPEARIDGQVLTSDGRPADKVRVVARAELGGGNRQLFTTRSQADGRFVIGNLGASEIRVAAEDRLLGLAASGPVRVQTGERKQLLLRLAPGMRLAGRVREDGRPASAWVTALQGPKGMVIRRTVRSGEDGSFVLESLGAGETHVIATVKEPPADLAEIPPVRQRATVVLPDGPQPAAGAPLELAVAR